MECARKWQWNTSLLVDMGKGACCSLVGEGCFGGENVAHVWLHCVDSTAARIAGWCSLSVGDG